MPMYEYKCRACGYAFERYAAGRAHQEAIGACPRCGKSEMEKLFSTFSSSSSCCGSGTVTSGTGGCGGGSSSFS